MNKKKRINSAEQRAQFGKYEGKLISWIVENDPGYAQWLITKSNSKTKTKRAAQCLIDKQNQQNNE